MRLMNKQAEASSSPQEWRDAFVEDNSRATAQPTRLAVLVQICGARVQLSGGCQGVPPSHRHCIGLLFVPNFVLLFSLQLMSL